jgi:hypothetical protein
VGAPVGRPRRILFRSTVDGTDETEIAGPAGHLQSGNGRVRHEHVCDTRNRDWASACDERVTG